MVAHIHYIFLILVSINGCSGCMRDYKQRDFMCRINALNRIVFFFESNRLQLRSKTSEVHMRVHKPSRNASKVGNTFHCIRFGSDSSNDMIKCVTWDLKKLSEYSHSINSYKLSLVEVTNQIVSTNQTANQTQAPRPQEANQRGEYVVWQDKDPYRPNQYSCNCKGYYEVSETNGTSSYEEIVLKWRVKPWMFVENYEIKYFTNEGGTHVNVTIQIHKICPQQQCVKKISNLRHCTKYRFCVLIKEARDCVDIRTKCVSSDAATSSKKQDSLQIEIKISLGGMAAFFFIACFILVFVRWKRKPSREVVEQLIKPRGNKNFTKLNISSLKAQVYEKKR